MQSRPRPRTRPATSPTSRRIRPKRGTRSRSWRLGKWRLRAGLAALREDTRDWWESMLAEPEEDERPFSPDGAGLTRFLHEKVEPWYDNKRQELENRPLLRSQALGQALEPERLQELARYEVHLVNG